MSLNKSGKYTLLAPAPPAHGFGDWLQVQALEVHDAIRYDTQTTTPAYDTISCQFLTWGAYTWLPNSNLANLVIYMVFINKSTFCHINGHPKQYIPVDTIFNYRFHFGLPGKCL